MDFHHVDPSKKSFTLASARAHPKKWALVVEEARLCVMLCANCHRKHHAGLVEIPHDAARFDEAYAAPEWEKPLPKCPECGKNARSHANIYCSNDCASIVRRRVNWDEIDLLAMYAETPNKAEIARQLGVSDVAVAKRIKRLLKKKAAQNDIDVHDHHI